MNSTYVVGVDPDSVAHGVAIFKDGMLEQLKMMSRIDLVKIIVELGAFVAIENNLGNNFLFSRNKTRNIKIDQNIMLKTGRCQNAQEELCRDLDNVGVQYMLYTPSSASATFKKDESLFKARTGWEKRSNHDTRSAAYFGLRLVHDMRLAKIKLYN